MAHTRCSQVPPISGNAPHPRALTCTMTMAARHDSEPEASFTIFIKPVERLGRIYKNRKANTRIGWIFSFVNITSEYT